MDLVRHGVNGWLFPSGRPDLLRGAVAELSADATTPRSHESRRPGKRRGTNLAPARRRAPAPLRTSPRDRHPPGPRGMRPSLVVSIHDVAPSTAWAARAWMDELDRRHVPATLLVVPGPWEGPPLRLDRDLVAWLHERRQRGDEIAEPGGPTGPWPGRRRGGTRSVGRRPGLRRVLVARHPRGQAADRARPRCPAPRRARPHRLHAPRLARVSTHATSSPSSATGTRPVGAPCSTSRSARVTASRPVAASGQRRRGARPQRGRRLGAPARPPRRQHPPGVAPA